MKKTGITTLSALILIMASSLTYAQVNEHFGPWPNPTGEPIGGGVGYSRMAEPTDYIVNTAEELAAALEEASSGEVVYVSDDAMINMTGIDSLVIPGGVTLASGRNNDDSMGALIFTLDRAVRPLFVVGGPDVRITGLRLRGPETEKHAMLLGELLGWGGRELYYKVPTADAIIVDQPNLEVDNCELYGWSHAAIYAIDGSDGLHVHHCYIHHNQRFGLGYGVALNGAGALIEANIFDYNRHHIAGTGRPGTSYEARYNIILEHGNSHSFDMHGGADRGDGTDIAGTWISIHHNMFTATEFEPADAAYSDHAIIYAINIRGVPVESCEVYNNWFFHRTEKTAVIQTNAQGNMTVGPNVYGPRRLLNR